MKSHSQIKLGAIISYFALAVNIIITLVYTPWMVSKIGKEQYGLYTLAVSLINLFLIDFGLSTSVSRFVTKYRAEKNDKKISEFVAAVSRLYIVIDVIILLILLGVFPFLGKIYSGLTPQEMNIFRILFLVVAVFNLISFPATTLSGYLNAYEQFVPLKVCDLLNKVLSVLIVIPVLLMGGNVICLVLATAIVGILVIMFKCFVVKKRTDIRFTLHVSDNSIYKEILSFSVWTMLITVAQRMLYNTTPSILAITTSSSDVAYFSPAFSIQGYYYSIAAAINGLFLPRISRYLHDREENKLLPLMVKVGRYQMYVMGVILVGFVVIGREFMVLWMGPDFEITYFCTICMIIPQLFECSQQIGYTSITAKGLVKYQATLMMVTGMFGLVMSYFFSKFYGVIGSCVVLLLVGLLNVLGIDVIIKKKLQINIFSFYKECYLRNLCPVVITILLGMKITSCVHFGGITGLLIKGIIVGIIYTVLEYLFVLQRSEKSLIKGLIVDRLLHK